jgi:hypothetical protein
MAFQLFARLPTLQTWLLVISGCSPKLKRPLKSSRFDRHEDIMRNTTKELRSLPEEAYQKCFQQWKEGWVKCVESQRAYFEGD